jgi:hypothetical protein
VKKKVTFSKEFTFVYWQGGNIRGTDFKGEPSETKQRKSNYNTNMSYEVVSGITFEYI